MNILDAIILIALIPAIIQGLRKGFISQAISIISVIAGIWASARFANMVTAWVSQYITASEQILKIIAFALILVIVFIILGVLGKLLEGVLKLVMLGWVNKLLGVVFSLFKAFLIIGLVIIAFNALNNSFGIIKPEVISDSVLYEPVKSLADAVFPYIKSMLTFNK
jgi:membrane protein required for colicin V production